MRFHCKAVAGLLVALTVASISLAQFQFGGRGGSDLLSLLNNPQIRKELGISEEQTEKIPDAVFDALAKVLDAKQAKRLREIQLQQRGDRALLDTKVQKELKMTDSQKESVATILEDSAKELAKLGRGRFGGFGGKGKGAEEAKEAAEKLAAARKEVSEKVLSVLNADQRNAYKQLLGEEFKMERPTFGGFGGKGGFGKKKDEKKDE